MLDITRDLACERIALFASEGRLVQSSWHGRGNDGRELACLLGAIDRDVNSPNDCPASVMPSWMAHLLPTLFDGVADYKAISYGVRFATALRTGDTDESVMRKFLVACVESSVNSARPLCEGKPYWDAVDKATGDVITLFSGNHKPTKAAADAAAYAARAAARAAYATYAARAAVAADAAYAATYAAARAADAAADAATYAARAAVAADAAYAARAAVAARETIYATLFDVLISAMTPTN